MNLYNQLKSDFIGAKPPSLAFTMTFCLKLIIVTVLYSCCLTCLLLLTLSTTIFYLKDLTIGSQFVVPLLTGFGRPLQTAINLPSSKEKNHNLANSNVACLKALSFDPYCTYFIQHHWLTFCVIIR